MGAKDCGVANAKRQAFVCEVVTHLTTGILYVGKDSRPDTANRLIKKFIKDIDYGAKAFSGYAVSYMLWSPVVRKSNGNVKYDQFAHLRRVTDEIESRTAIHISLITNDAYIDAIEELRAYAGRETKELKSPIMRFLQIEEWARRNVKKLELRGGASEGIRSE